MVVIVGLGEQKKVSGFVCVFRFGVEHWVGSSGVEHHFQCMVHLFSHRGPCSHLPALVVVDGRDGGAHFLPGGVGDLVEHLGPVHEDERTQDVEDLCFGKVVVIRRHIAQLLAGADGFEALDVCVDLGAEAVN